MVTKKIFVSGRVQGVGFRYHTQEKARSLGVLGWVRNLDDGRVEVNASGASDVMLALIAWLKVGPTNARVDTVVIEDTDENEPSGAFEIRR